MQHTPLTSIGAKHTCGTNTCIHAHTHRQKNEINNFLKNWKEVKFKLRLWKQEWTTEENEQRRSTSAWGRDGGMHSAGREMGSSGFLVEKRMWLTGSKGIVLEKVSHLRYQQSGHAVSLSRQNGSLRLSCENEVLPGSTDINLSFSDDDLNICILDYVCGLVAEHFPDIAKSLTLIHSSVNEWSSINHLNAFWHIWMKLTFLWN